MSHCKDTGEAVQQWLSRVFDGHLITKEGPFEGDSLAGPVGSFPAPNLGGFGQPEHNTMKGSKGFFSTTAVTGLQAVAD